MPELEKKIGGLRICFRKFDFLFHLGDGFKPFSCSPLFGEDEPILTCAYFSKGWGIQPPTSHGPTNGFSKVFAPHFS